jgi:hypothetical protein
MKKNLYFLILGLGVALSLFCSKKDKVTNPIDTRAGHNIAINATEMSPYGLDSLFISPGTTLQLKASTLLPATPPDYEWSVGNNAVVQLNAVAGDSSLINAVAAGDSGASTTITIKDLANSQDKSIVVKVAVWADMEKFTFLGTVNKHHYFVSKGVADWATAKTKCEDNNGHLVTITSADENAMVKKGVEKVKDEAWIGIRFQYIFDPDHPTDRSKDKKWTEWITGELVAYTNWDSGKPDFTTYNQDWETRYFGCMVATGKWVNRRAMTKYYVLEIP